MKLKLDENIGLRGRNRLVEDGRDVSTVHEQSMGAASDVVLAARCAEENRALVTLDLDFANPRRCSPETTAGIAVLRLPKGATSTALQALIETLASR